MDIEELLIIKEKYERHKASVRKAFKKYASTEKGKIKIRAGMRRYYRRKKAKAKELKAKQVKGDAKSSKSEVIFQMFGDNINEPSQIVKQALSGEEITND